MENVSGSDCFVNHEVFMSLRSPTEFEIFGIHHGGHRERRDLVGARASRAKSQNLSSVFSVCSVVKNHPGHWRCMSRSQSSPHISNEDAKSRMFGDLISGNLRVLRASFEISVDDGRRSKCGHETAVGGTVFSPQSTQRTQRPKVLSCCGLCHGSSNPIFSVISVPSVVKSKISFSVGERKLMKHFVVKTTL